MDDGVVPLDVLGTGAQTLFSMLATLALANANIVLIEEPESHLNALLQEGLSELLQQEITENIGISQIFIATHSTSFARPGFDLRHIERKDGRTVITKIQSLEQLQQYATPTGESIRNSDSRLSLLGYDGSVRLPTFVLDGLNIQPGQFVYFVKYGSSEFKIINEETMRDALGDDE